VIDGGIEAALSSLNAAYGDKVEVTCTPLRTYKNFGKKCPRSRRKSDETFDIDFPVAYSLSRCPKL